MLELLQQINYQYMNYDKVHKYFDWKPKTDFDEGLNLTIKWYKQYLQKVL